MCSLNVYVIDIDIVFVFVFVFVVVFLLVSSCFLITSIHQFCMVSVWSGSPEGFVSITANMTEQSISKVGLELLGQLNIIMRKPAVSSSSFLIRMMIGTKANPHSSVAASAKNWIQIAPPWIHKPPTPSHHNHYDKEEEDRSTSSFYNCMVKIMN